MNLPEVVREFKTNPRAHSLFHAVDLYDDDAGVLARAQTL
jgi:hypothetical protein